ncbi:MAG TPA: T9SS type A sorting domain-containing protein, partial [bacterium]
FDGVGGVYPATSSKTYGGGTLNAPTGLMKVGNLLYVTNSGANQIVSFVTTQTNPTATVVLSNLSLPRGLRQDLAGNFYVTEAGGMLVDRYDSNFGNPHSCLIPNNPWGVAVNAAGNIFVSEINGASVTVLQGCVQEPTPPPGMAKVGAELVIEGRDGPTSTATPLSTSTVMATPTLDPRLVNVVAAPNISRNETPIQFHVTLGQSGQVQLTLFNLMGEQVYQASAQDGTGDNILTWHLQNQVGSDVASGLYLYRITISGETLSAARTGKVVVFH